MRPARDFAARGAALLAKAHAAAKRTRGRFDAGEDAVLLEAARLYALAAANGLFALAGQPSLTEVERSVVGGAAHAFRRALGVLATHFPPGEAVPSVADLRDPAALAARFVPAAAAVSVSSPARDALDALRRDHLVIAEGGPDALLALMAQAAAGTAVAP